MLFAGIFISATDLGILRVDPMETLGRGVYNTVDDTFLGELKAKYPSVFQGIGKLKRLSVEATR